MKKIFTSISFFLAFSAIFAQEILPRGYSSAELEQISRGEYSLENNSRAIETPPPFANLRSAAEWEEIQALTISWTGFPGILKQIVAE